ncbi:MAG: gamma-glutamylcyclotransferase [Alphaproteobacteria bacterium]|nr:MAG: gamma-glutamylcyclotransferase [Alphaproteobacteria bacterium]
MNVYHLPLFAYGTLRDPDLIGAVLGRPLRPGSAHPARAPGFKAVYYPGRIYPALIRSPGAGAEGVLITGLSPFERDLLDAYEGDEYRRGPIATMLADEPELHEADAYLPVVTVPTDAHEWSLSRWQAEHKTRAIVSESAEAARLRERLIAIRPN